MIRTKTPARLASLFAATAGVVFGAMPARAQLANSYWPVFQQNLQHTGQSPIDGPTSNALLWTFKGHGPLRSAPSVGVDGTIFIGNGKAPYCALDPGTGLLDWCSTVKRGGDAGQSQPAVSADGLIYGGARDNDLWAIWQTLQPDPDDQTAWRYHVPFDGDVTAPPIVGPDNTIYFASNAIGLGFVYAWNPATVLNPGGTQKWFRQLGKGVHNSSPTLNASGDTVYFSTTDSMIHALNAATGETRWTYQVYPGSNGFRQANFTVVAGPDGRLYVGARDGLHAIDPNPTNTDATEAWHFDTAGRMESAPALANDGTLYFGASRGKKGTFYAVNPNGTLKWSKSLFGRFQNCQAAIGANGTVYLSVGKAVYSLNPANGAINWQYAIPVGEVRTGPVIGAPGVLYVATLRGILYAFGTP